ncbi:MAG: glycosyltransferase family 4 protein [Gemmatimonadaceae bacterium]|nr:glycosyltransferase family 4 protein [Gemmatimonadaceae bacterium]
MSTPAGAVRVAIPCTGLGRQRRGFEAFTREVSAALRGTTGLEVAVYGGGGDVRADERAVWNLPRASRTAKVASRLTGRGSYHVEQATFFAGFLPHLIFWRPHLVYFADLNFGNACWHWRRVSGQRFTLLFYNGGATTQPFTRCDWVQQLTPEHFDDAVARGESADRMFVLPHGVPVPRALAHRNAARVAATRRKFGVPDGRPLLLSVGMLDCSIKRMDALIEAVADMGGASPFVVLLGQETEETPRVRERARELLPDGHWIGTWPAEHMAEAYEAADVFALLSLREGFGLAYVEALAAGLPCVAHETTGTRHLFGEHAWLGDLRDKGTVTTLVRRALRERLGEEARQARHRYAQQRFSWETLAPQYAEMLRACAAGRRPAWSDE